MLGDSITQKGWPACGEIDILEWIGRDPGHVYGSLHAPSFDTTHGFNMDDSYSHNYHTYGVNWQPEQIDFYVDDKVYSTIHKNQSGGHWPFENQNFFIILNLAVGGNWPGNPDGSTQFPAQFVIDYVRVYEIDWSAAESAFLN